VILGTRQNADIGNSPDRDIADLKIGPEHLDLKIELFGTLGCESGRHLGE